MAKPLIELPEITDLASLKAALQLIMEAAFRGQKELGAAVRAGECWLKAHDSELDRHHLKELTALVGRLEAENKKLKAELAKRGGLRVTA
jgi:hypothetical protein